MPQFNSPLCFKSYNFLKNLFSQREYCSRNYVPNEINHDSLKWSSIIFDDALPSPRHPHHAAKFIGCVPPESGSTIFQAWWWDVYNPQLEFTLESRQLNQRRMAQIKVSTYSSVVAHKGRHVSQITVARLIVDKNSTLYVWERCFVCCKAKHHTQTGSYSGKSSQQITSITSCHQIHCCPASVDAFCWIVGRYFLRSLPTGP